MTKLYNHLSSLILEKLYVFIMYKMALELKLNPSTILR